MYAMAAKILIQIKMMVESREELIEGHVGEDCGGEDGEVRFTTVTTDDSARKS